jgi:hypothetical protein
MNNDPKARLKLNQAIQGLEFSNTFWHYRLAIDLLMGSTGKCRIHYKSIKRIPIKKTGMVKPIYRISILESHTHTVFDPN